MTCDFLNLWTGITEPSFTQNINTCIITWNTQNLPSSLAEILAAVFSLVVWFSVTPFAVAGRNIETDHSSCKKYMDF